MIFFKQSGRGEQIRILHSIRDLLDRDVPGSELSGIDLDMKLPNFAADDLNVFASHIKKDLVSG